MRAGAGGRARGLDLAGQATAVLALGAPAPALIEGGRSGWCPVVFVAIVVALLAGLALLPQMGVVAVSGRFTARRGGPRPTLVIGLVVGGLGLLGQTVAGAGTSYWLLVVPLVAAGFGMSFTRPAATTAVTESAPEERAGLAAGVINASRQTGSVIGVALLGGLVGGGLAFGTGLRIALTVAGGAFFLGALLALLTVDRRAARGS